MPSDPIWLPKPAVIDFNRQAVEQSGENHALLDDGKLEGALMRPQNLYCYTHDYDTVSLSVSYMMSIAQAHAFEQGNKRTGFMAGFAFMYANGFELLAEADNELLAVVFIETLEGSATASYLEDMLKESITVI